MDDRDADRLADRLEGEADELQRRSGELRDRVKGVHEDWQRKRADQSVPGAPAPEGREDDTQEEGSPAPEAPPPEAGPGDAETPSEGAAGPPSDTDE